MREPGPHPFAGLRELEPPHRGPLASALRELGPLETAAEVIAGTVSPSVTTISTADPGAHGLAIFAASSSPARTGWRCPAAGGAERSFGPYTRLRSSGVSRK